MRLLLAALLSLSLGDLGLCLAIPKGNVRWCAISSDEARKCYNLQKNMKRVGGPPVSCIKKDSYRDCLQAISENKADAITLDGGQLYEAALDPYNLRPVAAEVYGSEANPRTHYYAVAVAKRSRNFRLDQLQGLRSCHTGINRTAGWRIPTGVLRPFLNWRGPPEPIEAAVAKFFSASCVPGVDGVRFPSLCRQCSGTGTNKCAFSTQEPYFGYSGAFKCLRDGAGDVAFIKASTVFEDLPDKAQREEYKLLCPDNTWRPVDEYKQCHLARVPSHAIVARSVNGREDLIWEFLRQAQEKFGKGKSSGFQLFGSPRGKRDLLFKDSALGFVRVPKRVDAGLYLGFGYLSSIRNMQETEADVAARYSRVVWCAIGPEEKRKCDRWSGVSGGKVTCVAARTTEDCITLTMKGEADAMSLDGGFIYSAGRCGLVPVLAENQRSQEKPGSDCVNRPPEGYLAVAAVRTSDTSLTWNSLRGRKSCHTGVDRTAGWVIPMGLILNQTRSCRFDEFFSQSCAPGANPTSRLCALCVGNDKGEKKCVPNSQERYFGYTGAFRCLAERAGEVAFLKDSTVLQNTDGKNTESWAQNLKLEDFQLLCLDGTRKPVTEARSCHLAMAPNHAVVSRKDKAKLLEEVLLNQQTRFGRNGSRCPGEFCLFQSETKNLLFNDNTECLARLHGKTTYEEYLGREYLAAITNLKRCSPSPLLEACDFLSQ
ncbi:lactotransferrin [Cavia porcellus]|uniref:Lactotransferrin n=1 Tax=Cavia porcellus TaxID=10141 RepID=A0A286Y4A0_CAVPO|nr:lactotransferrin [Cavia porcellus]